MKTPDPTITAESSAPNSAKFTGTFPVRHGTVTADVLSRLISGESLTGMNAVFEASTTRLSAVVFRLAEEYGWSIEHTDLAVGTNDGRVATIRAYYMSRGTIRSAYDISALEFCRSVKATRARLRNDATSVCAKAAARNVARAATVVNPSQLSLEY